MYLKIAGCGIVTLLVFSTFCRAATALVNPFEGKPVVELRKVLTSEKAEAVRVEAVQALIKISPAGQDVIDLLIEALSDTACMVRGYAMKALAKAGAPAVPKLIKSLKSDNVDVRAYAAGALAEMTWSKASGVRPEVAAVPALTDALKDKDYSVRVSAARALGGIGTNAFSALPRLIVLLNDEEWAVADVAVQSVAAVDPGGKESVPALVKALNNRKHDVREFICIELKKIGPNAEAAIPALVKQLDEEGVSWYASKAAAEALVAIDSSGKRVVGPIAESIAKHKQSFIKESLMIALFAYQTDLGPEIKPAMPYIIQTFKTWTVGPRSWNPVLALVTFMQYAGPQAKDELVPLVKIMLTDKTLDERKLRMPIENLLKKLEG